MVVPNKKLREIEHIPAYFRIIQTDLKPSPWLKSEEDIKDDLLRKGKFDIKFFRNNLDYNKHLNQILVKSFKNVSNPILFSGSLKAKRQKHNKRTQRLWYEETPDEERKRLLSNFINKISKDKVPNEDINNCDYDGIFEYKDIDNTVAKKHKTNGNTQN